MAKLFLRLKSKTVRVHEARKTSVYFILDQWWFLFWKSKYISSFTSMVLQARKIAVSCKPPLYQGRGLSKNKTARLDFEKKCGVHRFCSDTPKTTCFGRWFFLSALYLSVHCGAVFCAKCVIEIEKREDLWYNKTSTNRNFVRVNCQAKCNKMFNSWFHKSGAEWKFKTLRGLALINAGFRKSVFVETRESESVIAWAGT